jgi:hypothetical protein
MGLRHKCGFQWEAVFVSNIRSNGDAIGQFGELFIASKRSGIDCTGKKWGSAKSTVSFLVNRLCNI